MSAGGGIHRKKTRRNSRDGSVVSRAWPLQGILCGYEGHVQMGTGRDRMIKRTEGATTGDLFSG